MSARQRSCRRLRRLLLGAAAAGFFLSCAEPVQTPVEAPAYSVAVIPGVIISNPVLGAVSSPPGASLNAADEVAYVSFAPGTLEGVLSVRIRNLTTNSPATDVVPVVEGGIDPVAVAARAGDWLALLMNLENGSVTTSSLMVPARRPPRIVRTAPPKGRTDVAFNMRPLIVFSEPIDARTLNNTTIQLLTAGITVNGTVTPLPGDPLVAEFTPAAPLVQYTDYELLITTDVRDLEGDRLEASERVPFTTQTQAGSPSLIMVDSFKVIEYRVRCSAWDCPYLIYAPLLRLREPTGQSYVDVLAVEFVVPTKTTGWCVGEVRYQAGQSAHLNYIDPYPWSNDLILVSLDGVPVPDGSAIARLQVRDQHGRYQTVQATGPIERAVIDPVFPDPVFPGVGWSCPWM